MNQRFVSNMHSSVFLGVDVGSTTAKVVAVDGNDRQIFWSRYQRHETRQAECVLALLEELLGECPALRHDPPKVYMTGSGAGPIAPHLGAKFVQEVNAVTLAVEALHPDVSSVVELGGQDAKIIVFKTNQKTGEKRAITSMNDKCASGTGATIDKCVIKAGMPLDQLSSLKFNPDKLHHVAAKCGVFAETDIVSLVKNGIPANEIMCSLADAIVGQNLSVLTRGNTLKSKVLLLGGPNTYLPFLKECWQYRIPQTWLERGYDYPRDVPIDEQIFVPENSEYYAAYGAILFGMMEGKHDTFKGLDDLKSFIAHGRHAHLGENAGPPLSTSKAATEAFIKRYSLPEFRAAEPPPNSTVQGYLGVDGGSTSSKCVLINERGEILQKVYQLSRGNPLEDVKQMFFELREWANQTQSQIEVLGFGVTGYAGDVLESTLKADANIVETVAHMKSAQSCFPNVDVICDVGGQDIKVLFMENRTIKNFRLSNSCSAGNGMLLQAIAGQFGVPLTEYADRAFRAKLTPKFSYGCAVFLDSDRVNFQKEGYNAEELLAGLALVLPKNIWQYVVQVPRMAELGREFVLQGGTQKNLAALKAQIDYICDRVPGAQVHLHPHPAEAGALGAAFEAKRVVKRKGKSSFAGLDAAINLEYATRNDESTRCHFCANDCSRTFIDVMTPGQPSAARYISGFSCERGTVEDRDSLRVINQDRRQRMKSFPNLVDYEARWNFKSFYRFEPLPNAGSPVQDVELKPTWLGTAKPRQVVRDFQRSSPEAQRQRERIRVGIPKALNIWSTGPFWRTYFEVVGIQPGNVVFSDDTSSELWQAGGKYGSVDPCFPAKVTQAHIHNLLFDHHEKRPLDLIFFPSITHIPTFVENVADTACCPIVSGTPNVIKAMFRKETDFFAQRGIRYVDPAVSLSEPRLLKRRMYEQFRELLGISEDENNFAIDQAFLALQAFDKMMQDQGSRGARSGDVRTSDRAADDWPSLP